MFIHRNLKKFLFTDLFNFLFLFFKIVFVLVFLNFFAKNCKRLFYVFQNAGHFLNQAGEQAGGDGVHGVDQQGVVVFRPAYPQQVCK